MKVSELIGELTKWDPEQKIVIGATSQLTVTPTPSGSLFPGEYYLTIIPTSYFAEQLKSTYVRETLKKDV